MLSVPDIVVLLSFMNPQGLLAQKMVISPVAHWIKKIKRTQAFYRPILISSGNFYASFDRGEDEHRKWEQK